MLTYHVAVMLKERVGQQGWALLTKRQPATGRLHDGSQPFDGIKMRVDIPPAVSVPDERTVWSFVGSTPLANVVPPGASVAGTPGLDAVELQPLISGNTAVRKARTATRICRRWVHLATGMSFNNSSAVQTAHRPRPVSRVPPALS